MAPRRFSPVLLPAPLSPCLCLPLPRLLLTLCPLTLCLLAAGCSRHPAPLLTGAAQVLPPAAPILPVRVVAVRREPLEATVRAVGVLTAERHAEVMAQSGGQVLSVMVREGEPVRAGQVIVRLYDTDAQARLSHALSEASLHRVETLEATRIARWKWEQARRDVELTRVHAQSDLLLAQARLTGVLAHLHLLQAGARPQELERARADVEGAQASVLGAEKAVAYADLIWKRKTRLLARGLVSQQEVDTAEFQVQQAQANLLLAKSQQRGLEQTLKSLEAGSRVEEIAQAQAEVQAAQEAVNAARQEGEQVVQKQADAQSAASELRRAQKAQAMAQWDDSPVSSPPAQTAPGTVAAADIRLAREELAKTVVRAPIAGIVAQRHVNPGDTVQVGRPLLDIVNSAALYLDAAIPDRDLLRVQPGQRVQIAFEGDRHDVLPGVIQALIPPANSGGQGFRASIRLLKTGTRARVGMMATGSIVTARYPDALTLPAAALINFVDNSGTGDVFVVQNAVATRRHLTLGERVGERLLIRAGLREGEQVVIEGQALLKSGQRVAAPKPLPAARTAWRSAQYGEGETGETLPRGAH